MSLRIAVTGASGFVGRAVMAAITASNHNGVAVDRRTLDLTDLDAVAAFYDRHAVTAVIALGAPAPSQVDLSPAGLATALTGLDVLVAALPEGARFLYTGSMAEFGTAGHHHDDALRRPVTAYGCFKALAADRVRAALATHGVKGGIARLFGIYGSGEAPHRLIPALLASLRQSQAVALSDGLQTRDFVHVEDAAVTLLALLEADIGGGSVNVGTGQGHRVRDVCRQIARTLGRPEDLLQFGAKPRLPHDESLLIAKTERLSALIGAPPPDRLSDPGFWPRLIAAYEGTGGHNA